MLYRFIRMEGWMGPGGKFRVTRAIFGRQNAYFRRFYELLPIGCLVEVGGCETMS